MKSAFAPETHIHQDPDELAKRWQDLLAEDPKMRIRNCAELLNVSELELLATRCGETATRLAGDWKALLQRVPQLGHVMALTRNNSMVHERHGVYREIGFFGPAMGQVVGPDIDLRLFMTHWHHGFAVEEPTPDGTRCSYQFFDRDGTAVHKIYLQQDSNYTAHTAIIEEFRAEDQSRSVQVEALPEEPAPKPDSEVDVEGFRAAWREMQDTHAFFGLLKKFGVDRTQALRLIGDEFAERVDNDSLARVLRSASEREAEIMVFVGSPGCIQIHTGFVQRIVPFSGWINVLDPDFNLHAKEDDIAESWIVRKPTRDGVVTSLELYDSKGQNLALLFGKRKPGSAEREDWREILKELKSGEGK